MLLAIAYSTTERLPILYWTPRDPDRINQIDVGSWIAHGGDKVGLFTKNDEVLVILWESGLAARFLSLEYLTINRGKIFSWQDVVFVSISDKSGARHLYMLPLPASGDQSHPLPSALDDARGLRT